MAEPQMPHEAQVVERVQESPTIFTLRLKFTDPAHHGAFRFEPGQFNMLYLHGVGEVPIIPPVAAVGNAVCRATGLRLVDLPLSPPKISEALDAAAPRLAAE